ncbi:hypothetical protein BVI434_360018 [Burkholderia vietnamiensis]|nr:hypothetical protein BVI2075_430072 [Burkholderia vietnamiensis]CAG9215606.1 hypothetical protein BVI1335_270037 [Burkholderia vietnamiensis]CAG9218945.1 hypothetical protein BVI434_360018 [Burkholderia vietnamiensis]
MRHFRRHAFVGETLAAVRVAEQHRLGRDHDQLEAGGRIVERVGAGRRGLTRQLVVLLRPVDRDQLVALHVAGEVERQAVLARPLHCAVRYRIDLRRGTREGLLAARNQALGRCRALGRLLRSRGRTLGERARRRHQQRGGQRADGGSDQEFLHGVRTFRLSVDKGRLLTPPAGLKLHAPPEARSGRYFDLFGCAYFRFSGSVTFFVVSQTCVAFARRRFDEIRMSAARPA